MMNNVSKSAALLNAQSIMCAAVLFGHGDRVNLVFNSSAIVLMLDYDDAYADYEREMKWLSDRFMCGCSTWKVDDVGDQTFTIFISWAYNPNLK